MTESFQPFVYTLKHPDEEPSLSVAYDDPRLYLFVRNDMDSMNPGKAVAQGSHAANKFTWSIMGATYDDQKIRTRDVLEAFHVWVHQADIAHGHMIEEQGFGTAITKQVGEQQLFDIIAAARSVGFPAATAFDPSYPLLDGKKLHELKIHTCGYIFCGKVPGNNFLRSFNLMD
jgi:hypothetical protein